MEHDSSVKGATVVPPNLKRWDRRNGQLTRLPDTRVRCVAHMKVVFADESFAAHSARNATARGTPMKPYLADCGHWHTARIKRR